MAAKSSKAKPDKAARAEAKRERKIASKQRRKQILQAFNMQRKQDKALIPLMVGAFLLCVAVFVGIGLIFDVQWLVLPLGVLLGLLAAIFLFGRRMQSSAFSQAEGQPGAAAWVLDNLRGQWRVTQAVAGTTHLDAVHRVIGRPGVLLVAEGAPHRVRNLIAQEKKRTARLSGNIPIYTITVGDEEGQVPLRKLQTHLTKLPHNITNKQMDVLEGRLNALGSRAAAMPKGPLPPGAKMRSMQRTVRRR
ncbi:MAG TPA: DUF4191 domain-containing protein [Pseudonocardia sp.]|jgi:hypothetical protein|uniref:DUF4191 domain-containing protein n=1 Tax=Pseudonocardia sp. TaxID=60912 RepID=UPI002F3E3210